VLKIKIVSVGKLKEKAMRELTAEYEKRLSRYCSLTMVELADLALPEKPSQGEIDAVLKKEGREIEKHLSQRGLNIALCIEGKSYSSTAFAEQISKASLQYSEMVFVIGSSHGIDAAVKKQCGLLLSMSEMTFPHNFARLMLLEQIYRSFKIISGESYHK
jgi:ribosomal RNA large subunit methyltransferase H